MADSHTRKQRSYNMSRIHGKDTKPEEIVRHYLFSRGLRYRKNDRRYPGSPDIVLPRYNAIIFVNGCFWHRHKNCKYATIPKTNTEFWKTKFENNISRDKKNYSNLKKSGWNVLIVWECELKKESRNDTLERIYKSIIKGSVSDDH